MSESVKRLTPGSQLGPFRIETLLGAGGMGEVYRAQDTKLRRAVAIKVLPDSFAQDPDRRIRFEQEARALAALNHPHIGAIYGLEETSDVVALILELVDGPTLGERLAAGPLSIDETLRIARQLAEALEAAHDRGIIHRDLKPGNIKITPDGVVKVLDFGLAKAVNPQEDAPEAADARTVTGAGTRVGLVVGTAGYMSPEQARGHAVDKRTDVWAFGCVLFEMCARRPAFAGATVTDTLAAVIEREPDWQRLPSRTPPYLLRLLHRCLTKDPKLRLRDIGEARIQLASGGDTELTTVGQLSGRRITRAAAIAAGAATLFLSAAVGLGVYFRADPTVVPDARPVRFELFPPAGALFNRHPARTFFALSPNGSQLAFVAYTDQSRVWLRAMARPVAGTEGATSLFWSPDSRSLAFFADGKLKRVDASGGAAVTICDVPAAAIMHGTWGTQGVILLGLSSGPAIYSVAAAGGSPAEIVKPDASNGEVRVHWPWFLPDGQRFLYTARRNDGDGRLRLAQIGAGGRDVMPVSSNTQWVNPDIVVFVREGVLMGQRVDVEAGRPIDEPFSISERVEYFFTTSRAMFSASHTGTVAYHAGMDIGQLVWVDQNGNERGAIGSPGDYEFQSVRLSRSGNVLLVARRQPGLGTYDIWRLDLVRNTEERITADRGSEVTPVWIDDERAILFAGDQGGGTPHMFRKDLATGREQEVLPRGMQQLIMDVFPDGRTAAFLQRSTLGGFDIFQIPLTGSASPVPLLTSRMDKYDMRLSPDGRAMSFVAADSGRADLYVAPVPITSAPLLVAAGAGGLARWSGDGRLLYYVASDRKMTAIPVRTAPSLHVGTPQPLFEIKRATRLNDVSRDGRFVMTVPEVRAGERPITVGTHAVKNGSQ